MSHIFISYSRRDIAFAQKIVDTLAGNNLDTWIDWKSIPKGEDWEQEIYRGIEEADAFLFLISLDSVASEMCNKEIAHAVKNGKRILPIVIRDSDTKTIHPEISKRNWIFCRDGQDDFNKAIEETQKTIHTDYEWLKYHTELQVKALKWEQKKDNSRLLRGRELREADENFIMTGVVKDPQPTNLQRMYVLFSKRHEARQRRRTLTSLVFGFVIVLGIAVIAVWQWQRAEKQTDISLARQLAAQSQTLNPLLSTHALQSGLLAVEATQRFPSLESNLALRQAFTSLADLISCKPEAELLAISPSGAIVIRDNLNRILSWEPENNIDSQGPVIEYPMTAQTDRNGRMILTFHGKDIFVWDAVLGTIVNHWVDTNPVQHARINPNGDLVFSLTSMGEVSVWEVGAEEKFTTILLGEKVETAVFLSEDGQLFLKSEEQVYLWSRDRKDILQPLEPEQIAFGFEQLEASSTGRVVYGNAYDGFVYVWDLDANKVLSLAVPYNVYDLAISPDLTKIATIGCTYYIEGFGCQQSKAAIWDIGSSDELAQKEFENQDVGMEILGEMAIAFHPDSSKVIATGGDGTVRIWNYASGEELLRILVGPEIYRVGFSPDGKLAITVAEDGVCTWKADQALFVARIQQQDQIEEAALSPDMQTIASVGLDGLDVWGIAERTHVGFTPAVSQHSALIYSLDSRYLLGYRVGGNLAVFDIPSESFIAPEMGFVEVTSAIFAGDPPVLFWGDEHGRIYEWDLEDAKADLLKMETQPIRAIAVDLDNQLIAYSLKGTICLWYMGVDSQLCYPQEGRVKKISFTPKGDAVILVYNKLLIWSLANTKPETIIQFDEYSPDTISQDYQWVSALNYGSSLCLWGLESGEQGTCMKHETSKSGTILYSSFHPDNRFLLSSGPFANLHIWDISSGMEVGRILNASYRTVEPQFSRDGKYILFSRENELVISIWRPEDLIAEACKLLPRNLTREEWQQYAGDEPYHATCPNLPIPTD